MARAMVMRGFYHQSKLALNLINFVKKGVETRFQRLFCTVFSWNPSSLRGDYGLIDAQYSLHWVQMIGGKDLMGSKPKGSLLEHDV